jgi:predicted enzyme related to lactoylglutathione lyase
LKTVIYPVRDLAAATAAYTALLGVEPAYASEYYVGYEVGDQHLGLDPNGRRQGLTGPVGYWHVDDIATALESLTAAGLTVKQPPHDVGGGRLIALVEDADGNPTGLLQDRR